MDNIKSWIVVILTAIFVACYVAALFGWQATPNDKIVTTLAPIVAVIIGYFFGRMPSEKIENSLTQQANQRGVEAQHAREAQSAAELRGTALQQKVNDAVHALSGSAPHAPVGDLAITLSGAGPGAPDAADVRRATVSALKILQS
ncbi:MAG: hypothetical protein ABSA90_15675 [Xanthobacteraceae bacterium]|jgi:uncharacterized membrane protein YraQ (UPF0718 family)